MTPIKFCGLTTPATVDAAIAAGARYIGFNAFPPSPRYLTPAATAALTPRVPTGIASVAVLVDPDDALIDAMLAAGIDTLQLHGDESPQRLAAIRARTGVPVWRASGVATRADIAAAIAAAGPADALLLDARPAAGAPIPGGNGLAFDWRLLETVTIPLAWGLAGGLHPGNVAAALTRLSPAFVDVSSGIEDAPGVKSFAKIRAFAQAVRHP